MRRFLGIVMLVIGLAGIVLSITGAVVGRRLIGGIGNTLDANLQLTIQSLDTVNESLTLTRQTIRQIGAGLETLEVTGEQAASSLDDTRPMVEQISLVLTDDVAGGLETFQERLPDMVEVATTIDETLTTLSNFRIDRTILGIPLRYDLGINYDPQVPFAQSVEELGASMEGLPEELHVLETHLEVAGANLGEISANARQLSEDLGDINETMDELAPQLDDFTATLTEFADSARQIRANLALQLDTFQTVWVVVMVWLALTQIAPLYLGYELVRRLR
jgi:methyl-accepting chemotaxis protein